MFGPHSAAAVTDVPKLQPAEFEEIRAFAKHRFGLDLKNGKEDLVSARLARYSMACASRASCQGDLDSSPAYVQAASCLAPIELACP